ncbi:hypothetical protein [Niabella sp.]|nr:hypothetical protein [Niabella sp.]
MKPQPRITTLQELDQHRSCKTAPAFMFTGIPSNTFLRKTDSSFYTY